MLLVVLDIIFMVGGEGIPFPKGSDNATNPELVCLPCAQLGNQLGGAPTKKSSFVLIMHR